MTANPDTNSTAQTSDRQDVEHTGDSKHYVDEEIDAKCCFCFNLQTGLLLFLVLGLIFGVANIALLRNFSGFAGIVVNIVGIYAIHKRDPTWLKVFLILYGILLALLLVAAVLLIVLGGISTGNAQLQIGLFIAGGLLLIQLGFSVYIFTKIREFRRIVTDQKQGDAEHQSTAVANAAE